jgi:hypothetical protein
MTDARKQRFPRWWQALIIIASGIALGLSSCVGFLGTMNFSGRNTGGQALPLLLASGFFGGILIAFVGCVLLLIALARVIVDSLRVPAVDTSLSIGAGATPGGAAALPQTSAFAVTAPPDQPILRQFQMALVVLMLLPVASIATSVLVVLNRYRPYPGIFLILSTYVLSQVPYAFALARTRRGPDRLGIAIAFAASCVFFVEGLLPLFRFTGMLRYSPAAGLFFWPALFLIGHVVVAVFAWRAGQLSPPDEGDLGLIVTSFAGVIIYLVVVRFLEVHFLPFLLR